MACSSEGAMDRRLNQYRKILKLNDITKSLEIYGKELHIEMDLDSQCGIVPVGDFNEVVDLNNIHVWLSTYMELVEYRFALAVTTLVNEYVNKKVLEDIVYSFGKEMIYTGVDHLDRIYSYIDLNVLDGMPCDDTKEIVVMSEETLSWVKKMDMHQNAWNKAKGNIDNYYMLLNAFINGMLDKVDVTLTIKDNQLFTLKKDVQ